MAMIDPRDPLPGFYKQRLRRGGPWVAVRIWLEPGERDLETGELLSDDVIRARRDGRDVDPFQVWPGCASHPIDEAEHRYLDEGAAWDREHDPEAPAANPGRPVDINRTKPVF